MSDKMMENLGFPASWTDDQVRYASKAINQHDILTNRVKVLEEALKEIGVLVEQKAADSLSEGHYLAEQVQDVADKALEADNG